MDMNSLAHTKWECKYHIVFAPKFRRKVAYGELKRDIANILSTLCKRKGVEIVEAEICLPQEEKKKMLEEATGVSEWIYAVIRKVCTE